MMLTVGDHDREAAGLRHVYPVLSRRAGGVSIGINLNPNNACNWRCVYCQVAGLTRGAAPPIDLALLETELRGFAHRLVSDRSLLEGVPSNMRRVADLAISGNGEPTSAAEFPEVVDLLGRLRAGIPVLRGVELRLITNGSLLDRSSVQRGIGALGALGGEVWFKVDAGSAAGFRRINGAHVAPRTVARRLRRCAGLCRTWVQTCVFRMDGAGPPTQEIEDYLALLFAAGVERLQGVLLYGLARRSMQAEAPRLSSLAAHEMDAIARRLRKAGLAVRVSP
ncbi:MAG: radical SAM protein [Rhodocyclaceae bacterium]